MRKAPARAAAALAVGRDHPDLEDGALLRAMHKLHFTGLRYGELRLQDLCRTPPTVCLLEAALKADNGEGFNCLWEATGSYHTVDGWELVKLAEFWTYALHSGEGGRRPVWPELDLVGEAILQTRRPDGKNVVWGDARPGLGHFGVSHIYFHLHARRPNPLYAELLRVWGAPAADALPVHALLCAAPDTLPSMNKGAADVPAEAEKTFASALAVLPRSAFVNPLVMLRSDWDADATLVAFRCGRHGGWHNHLDHNGFTVFRGGPLAIDSGVNDYDTDHRPEYSMRTIAHNCILVRNPREKFWYGRFGRKSVNDGGQRNVFISHQPPNESTGGPHGILTEERRRRLRDEFDMGRLLAFEPGRAFDYTAGDATRAYTYPWSGLGTNSSRRVEEAVRQIVFLKPDWVVVFDRVEATKAAYEKKWLLHSIPPPAFFADNQKQTAQPGLQKLPPVGPFEIEQERGRLTVWPLLPESCAARSVGGPGYEYWVDDAPDCGEALGRNYPPPKSDAESGAWRLEFSPIKPAKRDCFLVVLHAGLRKDASPVGRHVFAVQRKAGQTTLRISERGKEAQPWACVSFREGGPVEVEIEYAGEKARHQDPPPERVKRLKLRG